jgi:ectoine hydroxylase
MAVSAMTTPRLPRLIHCHHSVPKRGSLVNQSIDKSRFHIDGYLTVHDCFSSNEVSLLTRETESLLHAPSPGLVYEADGTSVRSLNGPHLLSAAMDKLSRTGRLLGAATKLLGGDVYVHQYKINLKRALVGEQWEWHSDYWYWQEEDGMPEPEALTAVIFLDDVTEFNGPLMLIPGSHHDRLSDEDHTRPYGEIDGGENWEITTASTLKYRLTRDRLSTVMEQKGLVAVTGKKGSVLFFHCNLLHYSSPNASAWDRRAIFISYNRVSNALVPVRSPRPEFLASRNPKALELLDRSDVSHLFQHAHSAAETALNPPVRMTA